MADRRKLTGQRTSTIVRSPFRADQKEQLVDIFATDTQTAPSRHYGRCGHAKPLAGLPPRVRTMRARAHHRPRKSAILPKYKRRAAPPAHRQILSTRTQSNLICAPRLLIAELPPTVQIGGSARFAQVEGGSRYVSGRGRSPSSRLWMPLDARTCEAHQARISRTCGGARKGSVCATRAGVQRGRRGSWTSSLDRVPQVSDAIRCRDDIRAVQF
jgi:hypothetical protein